MGVVISNNGICANPNINSVNVLPCQTVRPPNRVKKENEVYLNGADGLDWKTLVKCDFVLVINFSPFCAFCAFSRPGLPQLRHRQAL